MPEIQGQGKGSWLDNPWFLLVAHVLLFVVLYLLWGWWDISRVPGR